MARAIDNKTPIIDTIDCMAAKEVAARIVEDKYASLVWTVVRPSSNISDSCMLTPLISEPIA